MKPRLKKRYTSLDKTLASLLLNDQAIDVSIMETFEDFYILKEFNKDKFYIDAYWQTWISQIGRVRKPFWQQAYNGSIKLFVKGSLIATWSRPLNSDYFDIIYHFPKN